MSEPLRILYVAEACFAGVGRQSAELALEVRRRGHEVHFAYSEIRIDKPFQDFLREATNIGISTHVIPMDRSIGISDLESVRRLRQLIRDKGPFDVIHGQSSKGGAIARLAAPKRGVVRVYAPHAFVTMDPLLGARKRAVYMAIERALSTRADAIVLCSRTEEEHALSAGLPRRKLHCIEDGIPINGDFTRSKAREALGIDANTPVIGFVGRLSPQKDPELALKIVGDLVKSIPTLQFLVVGDGPSRESAEGVAKALGIEGHVRWLGPADARSIIPGLDALLLTSRYEGSGLVLAEAAAARVPFVSTPVGWASDLLRDAPQYLFPAGSPSQAVDLLRKLLTDPNEWERVSHAVFEAVQPFSLEKSTDRHIALYRDLASDIVRV